MEIDAAYERLKEVVRKTPLQLNEGLSEKYDCEVYLKREDLQIVRSYKLRGAYNRMVSLSEDQRSRGVVCASGGNHAQGVAFVGKKLSIYNVIYMPAITPRQKIRQVKMFGGDFTKIVLVGDTFDECQHEALAYAKKNEKEFISAFDHEKIVEGQGTVGKEINDELKDIDYLFIPIGGGGLIAGVSEYFSHRAPNTGIIGVEPAGAPSMTEAIKNDQPVLLKEMDSFVDGASIQKVGSIPFEIVKEKISEIILVPEGKVCSTILKLYNEEAIVAEPAGALSIAALDLFKGELKGKKIVCIVSGGNNDIERMEEIKERSLQYEGLKQYFIVRLAQRPGAIRDFFRDILGPNDDIVHFEFTQKNNKESSPALIGIEVKSKSDFQPLMDRMNEENLNYTLINKNENLFDYLVGT